MAAGRPRALFFNLGGGPRQSGDWFAFTEGGLAHAVHAFAPLSDAWDVTVVCPNVPLDVAGRRFEVGGVTIDCPSPPGPARLLWSDEFSFTERRLHTCARIPALLASYVRLRRDTVASRPDVVLANGVLGSYLAGKCRAFWPMIAVIHHLYHDPWTRGSDEATHGVTARIEKWLLRHMRVDGVAVVNPAVRDRLVGMGFEADRIGLVGNGVDASVYAADSGGRTRDLVYVGKLRKDKRVDVLIKAMSIIHRECPQSVLHIVGDGGQRRSLERLVDRHGLNGAVRFHGYVAERRKVSLLQSCSVYMSASRFEGFGIPVVEAMAAGAVPVVSDIPAHRFIFQEQEVGYLAAGYEEMADRAVRLLSDDVERERRAATGRQLVEERWTWNAVAERYRALIERISGLREVVPAPLMTTQGGARLRTP